MTTEPLGDSPHEDRFAPLTRYARTVLILGQEEAERFGSDLVNPEHLLLGVVKIGESTAGQIVRALDVELRRVREDIESMLNSTGMRVRSPARRAPRTRDRSSVKMRNPSRLAPDARKVLALAGAEAERAGSATIGTVHLLLAILREDGIAATVLEHLGITLDAVRARVEIMRALSKGQEQPPSTHNPNAPESPRIRMVEVPLDASTLDLLDLLVEAGIQETRADVLNWFIGAGISQCYQAIWQAQVMADEIRDLHLTKYASS